MINDQFCKRYDKEKCGSEQSEIVWDSQNAYCM